MFRQLRMTCERALKAPTCTEENRRAVYLHYENSLRKYSWGSRKSFSIFGIWNIANITVQPSFRDPIQYNGVLRYSFYCEIFPTNNIQIKAVYVIQLIIEQFRPFQRLRLSKTSAPATYCTNLSHCFNYRITNILLCRLSRLIYTTLNLLAEKSKFILTTHVQVRIIELAQLAEHNHRYSCFA